MVKHFNMGGIFMEDFLKEKETALYQDFEKEAEKEKEGYKLEEIIKLINEEILKYIEKRKYIYEYITDYRKSVIEEYRDDEDKIVEYFDHERFVKEEAFRTIDRRLKELVILVSAPYFGRVKFMEDDSESEESINIGRFGMTPDGGY